MTTDANEAMSAPQLAAAAKELVSLSKWVNEKFPAWDEILSAHDVARLTRRRCWFVHTLTLLGRFPKRRRFHGRSIGWGKREVLKWLAESVASQGLSSGQRHPDSYGMVQQALPMHFARTRRGQGRCSKRRKGHES